MFRAWLRRAPKLASSGTGAGAQAQVVIFGHNCLVTMETSDLLRHQIIENLAAPHTEKFADAAINLWEQMATQIISIVGEGGFNSLYARSVFITQSTFPWLVGNAFLPHAEHRFALLGKSFEAQTPSDVVAANSLLLIIFTDILASLIGEELTTGILRSAWGDEALFRSARIL